MPLTDSAVRNAKPASRPAKLFDGSGLYLLVAPNGKKGWRFKYRFDGKEKLLSFGVYPNVGLKQAREKRADARQLLATGVDPSAVRKATATMRSDRAANSFEAVAREWFFKHSLNWAVGHSEKIIRRLERDVFPWLGGKPIADVTAPDLLAVLRRIEARGVIETAHRVLQVCGQIFRYAIATSRAERNPAADLRGALASAKPVHFAAITDVNRVGDLLRRIDGYQGTFVVRCALALAPLVFVRPGELRTAEWSEFNLDAGDWTIPAHKMKMGVAHLVPLSTQAVTILRDLQPLTGAGRYVFPGVRNAHRPLSENTLSVALRNLGYAKHEMSTHGFRAMARTILDEVLNVRADLIEHQLSHAVRDPNGRAYNRTAHLPERRAMMQSWADYLDGLREGGNVVPFNRKSA